MLWICGLVMCPLGITTGRFNDAKVTFVTETEAEDNQMIGKLIEKARPNCEAKILILELVQIAQTLQRKVIGANFLIFPNKMVLNSWNCLQRTTIFQPIENLVFIWSMIN